MENKERNYIVDKNYTLKKFEGKGGWTYTEIPEIAPNKNAPFGWVIVSGWIDTYKLEKYKLMPLGNQRLFLAVKSAIRKHIKKEAGDVVHIKLFLDKTPLELPDEIKECFKQEPKKIYQNFLNRGEGEQKAFIDWIYQAKMDETKANRILEMFDKLRKNEKFYV